MVAAASTATIKWKTTATPSQNQNPKRPPLLPSETDNAVAPPRRHKSREVTSRYMSISTPTPSASTRCVSPLISRPTVTITHTPSAPSTIKRSQSVERRRQGTPRPNSLDFRVGNCNGEVSNAQKMLITSTRSFAVSFQGESFSLHVSKAKPAPSTVNVRKVTPERRKATTPTPSCGGDQAENSRPVEQLQHRWPGRLRQPQSSMSRSMDFTEEERVCGSGMPTNNNNAGLVGALQHSMMDNRSSIESRWSSDYSSEVIGSDSHCDTESVSSIGTSESSGHGGGGVGQRGGRGISVPARFLQETNNRLRRQVSEPGSPASKTVGFKGPVPPKLIAPKKYGVDSPVSSPTGVLNSRGQSSPVRGSAGALRPASPSKLGVPSPVRGLSSARVKNAASGVMSSNVSNACNTPSILSFAADIRRGKVGENRIVEVHLLRIFYNRLLQWRFVNARTGASLSIQRLNAEQSLYSACVTISKLRESVRAKRLKLQMLRQNLKLISILKGQMAYLEELALMDQDYCSSLSEAIEALRASTIRLPVIGEARADVQNVKDAIRSAVDVMQAMASSICLLSSKVGDVYSLVAELATVTAKERALLDQCKDFLSTISAMQVTESSLRTHILQLKSVPSNLTTKV